MTRTFFANSSAFSLAKYFSCLSLNILDETTSVAPQRDATSAQVFLDLAKIEGQSITALGNGCGWKMTGLDAAISIAAHEAWDGDDDMETFDKCLEKCAAIALRK
jgi:hypothetical protein